jgi:hypothetical protein
MPKLSSGNPAFDMALIASGTDAVVIGIGTSTCWGAYLSHARQKFLYRTQYHNEVVSGYKEEDYIQPEKTRVQRSFYCSNL